MFLHHSSLMGAAEKVHKVETDQSACQLDKKKDASGNQNDGGA
jgi:hypothetical protein